uniref:CSON009946 protein n=1 Tax=Culicoides sonorensis TaxID=179676 RepID=A0A336KAM5_CULSO
MEKEYRSEKLKKRSKKSKKSKKRRRQGTPVRDEFEFSTEDEAQNVHGGTSKRAKSPAAPLVEYSDVSSDDFSGPEAGEIESEGGGVGPDGSLSDISPDERQPIAPKPNNVNSFKTFDKTRLGPMDEKSGRSLSPKKTMRRNSKDQLYVESNASHDISKPLGLEEIGEESDLESAGSDMVIQRKSKKKDKKKHKKKKKKQKKKRAKSVSSVETISEEEDPILSGEPVTPPIKTGATYTPVKDPSLTPISPTTPPLSPTYASTKKRTLAAASPHTPPMPSKSATSSHHLTRISSSPEVIHVVHESSSSRSYYKHRSGKSRTPERRPYSPPDKRRRTDSRDHYVSSSYKRDHERSRERYRSKERYRRSPSPRKRSRSRKYFSRSRSISPRSRSTRHRSRSLRRTPERRSRHYHSSRSRSRSPQIAYNRTLDMQEKISDTSLFAELVKDRQKRAKVLKEILEPKDTVSNENSQDNSAVVVIPDNSPSSNIISATTNAASATNGLRSASTNNPTSYDMTDNAQMIHQIPVLDATTSSMMMPQPMPPSAIGTIITQVTQVSSSNTVIAINNNNKLGGGGFMKIMPPQPPPKPIIGGKTLTKLPLPPGTNVSELVNAKTPSPPRSPRSKPGVSKLSNKKGGLLNLPMPPMVPGSEDVSGDELDSSPRQGTGANGSHLTPNKKLNRMVKRPVILNRRNSRSAVGPGPGGLDWGERSVDVFEVLAQIGEGTYGQVS